MKAQTPLGYIAEPVGYIAEPVGYIAEPVEIADPVVFLASDHASYITGATINVSDGFLMY